MSATDFFLLKYKHNSYSHALLQCGQDLFKYLHEEISYKNTHVIKHNLTKIYFYDTKFTSNTTALNASCLGTVENHGKK